jgi:hypothetical protein
LGRTPSILTSILNGRDEIANAIYPVAARLHSQAVSSAAQNSTALTTTAALGQNGTKTPVAKTVADPTRTVSSTPKATHTGPKHAKK